jgi:hypothetical protein
MSLKPWNLDAGLKVVRELEALLSPLGWHVALAGSVLHQGESNDDLDVILYRHKTLLPCTAPNQLVKLLVDNHYFHRAIFRDHRKQMDSKLVWSCYTPGSPEGRVDLIFGETSIA